MYGCPRNFRHYWRDWSCQRYAVAYNTTGHGPDVSRMPPRRCCAWPSEPKAARRILPLTLTDVPQFLPFLIDLWQQGGPHLYSLLMTAKPNPQTDLFPFDELLTFYPAADFQKALHDMESGAVVKPVLVF